MFVFLITCDIYLYCDLQCLAVDATIVGWLVHNCALAGALQKKVLKLTVCKSKRQIDWHDCGFAPFPLEVVIESAAV